MCKYSGIVRSWMDSGFRYRNVGLERERFAQETSLSIHPPALGKYLQRILSQRIKVHRTYFGNSHSNSKFGFLFKGLGKLRVSISSWRFHISIIPGAVRHCQNPHLIICFLTLQKEFTSTEKKGVM